ncbi:MAG: hypothetical protein ACRC6B_00530, partial [Fusobacteriaceae bacterium]
NNKRREFMNFAKRESLKKQFKVEVFKGTKIVNEESYDFIEGRKFFPAPEEAVKYINQLKDKLEINWVIRYFKKVEENWELVEIIEQ